MTKEYKESTAMNQSLLKKILYDPISFKWAKDNIEKEEQSDSFKLGSLVDCLTFEPSEYTRRYLLSTVVKPSAQMGIYVDNLFKYTVNLPGLDLFEIPHLRAYEELRLINGGKLKDSLDKFKERFEVEGEDYYNFLLQSEGKIVISVEEYELAKKCSDSLLFNKTINSTMLNSNDFDWEVYYQYELFGKIKDVDSKGCLDAIRINHSKKLIEIYDLKTTSGTIWSTMKRNHWTGFMYDVEKYEYLFQQAFYKCLVKSDPKYFDYEVKNYIVPVSTKYLTSTIYDVTSPVIEEINKVYRAFDMYKFHEEHGYERHLDEKKGVIRI